VLNDVVLNQVVVAFGDASRTDAVIAAVQDDGTCWCGPTTWRGRKAMRFSVSCWNTTEDDVDKSIAAVRACARR
jgi:7-keto-8-aminopelargonate synthetase-like enzyme